MSSCRHLFHSSLMLLLTSCITIIFNAAGMAFTNNFHLNIKPKHPYATNMSTIGRCFLEATKRRKRRRQRNGRDGIAATIGEEHASFESPAPSQRLNLNHLTDFNLAPASQIAYFYLHKMIGLSEEVMWKITLERSSILGLTTANLEEKVNLLRSKMDLSEEDLYGVPCMMIRTLITQHSIVSRGPSTRRKGSRFQISNAVLSVQNSLLVSLLLDHFSGHRDCARVI